MLNQNPASFHIGVTRVRQAQDSAFSSASFALGAALARNDFAVTLNGPGASCHLNGLYYTAHDQHIDNLISIDHAQPHGTSRLNYKGILNGNSRAVFGGEVIVQPNAQKSNAQQTDKNLLLSKDAEVDSKPSLLIYADDVPMQPRRHRRTNRPPNPLLPPQPRPRPPRRQPNASQRLRPRNHRHRQNPTPYANT